MAFDIKLHGIVERPVIRSGRGASSDLPALAEEVKPLIAEALQLPRDKALPIVIPSEQASDLVRALRAAGSEAGVTVRFLRHPRYENGEQVTKVRKGDGVMINVTVPFEYTNKSRSTVRVTFWTAKKVIRKPKVQSVETAS